MSNSLLAALAAVTLSNIAFSQHLVQTEVADPPVVGGLFGRAVAMGTEFAAATQHATGNLPEVYVYRRTPVELELDTIIQAPPGGGRFGDALAIDGTTLVIGAQLTLGGGRVYVYEHVGGAWILEATLQTSVNEPGGLFGGAVDIDGDTIVAGAHGENAGSNLDGYVYFFEKSAAGWAEIARLRPAAAQLDSSFGGAVAIDGDLAVVGAPFNGIGTQLGAAWTFRRVGASWTLESQLVPATPVSNFSQFGLALDVEGERIAIGAQREVINGDVLRGAVHMFEPTTTGAWSETALVIDPLGGAFSTFGISLQLSDGLLLVGTVKRGGAEQGAALAFKEEPVGWRLDRVLRYPFDLTPPNPGPHFGRNTALSCGQVLMGTGTDDLAALNAGSLSLYDLDTGSTRFCTSVPNSTGMASLLFVDGCRDVDVNRLQLRAVNVPDGFGLGQYGDLQLQTMLGDGFSCVGGSVYRLPISVASGGTLRIPVDFTAPSSPAGAILVGSTWNFQTLFRDVAAGGTGFNSSDAISVTFGL